MEEIINQIIENRNYHMLSDKQVEAIEHLISAYKKLEEENKELKEEQCCMTTCLRKDKEQVFLEQKIRDKIEELNKELDSTRKYGHINKLYVVTNQISILKELLEEGNK